MNPYELSAWTLTAYFTLFGLVFWFIASRVPGRKEGTSIQSLFNAKLVFQLLGLVYIAFAHFGAYSALLMNIEHGGDPACEMILNQTLVSGGNSTYLYHNSCKAITTPPIQTTWFSILTWFFWGEIVMITLIGMFKFFKGWAKW